METKPLLPDEPTIQPLGSYRLIPVADFPEIISGLVTVGGQLGIDCEATGLDPWANKLVCIQVGDGQVVYVCDVRACTPDDWQRLSEAIRLLFSGKVELVGHNVKYDVLTLAVHAGLDDGDLRHVRLYDTMLAEQVILGGVDAIDGSGRERANLQATAARYDIPMTKDPRSYFIDLDKRTEWSMPLPEEQLAYSALDVLVLPVIRDLQAVEIQAKSLENTITLEMAAAPAIIAMELAGIAIDVPGWRRYLDSVRDQASTLERQIQAALFPPYLQARKCEQLQQIARLSSWKAGQQEAIATAKVSWETASSKDCRPQWGDLRKHTLKRYSVDHPRPKTPAPLPDHLNLSSPSQLKEALALCGVCLISTEAEVLEEEAKRRSDIPVLVLLCRWRKLNKLLTAFGESVLSRVQADGRLHPSWRQIGSENQGVATGRSSCSNPNLQQIPAHDDIDGDSIRQHIIASPGHVLVACDYSQMEMRILGERSQDPLLLEIFEKGYDIYTRFGVAVGLAPEDATTKAEGKSIPFGDSDLRDAMKTLTLAVSYGMGPRSLGRDLGVSEEKARDYLENFYDSYPGIKRYQEIVARSALSTGYSTTIGGRRRTFRIAPPPNRHQYTTWEGYMAAQQQYRIAESRIQRQAVNSTIQGTGADITKLALTLVFQRLPVGAHLVAAVHDELIVEAPEVQAEECAHILEHAMEQAARFYLPTVALGTFESTISTYWRKN